MWAFDEHRLGLKPLHRRVWARRGQRPEAVSHHKYRWLYLYGFVHPASGEVEWWLANSVGVALFQAVLDAFADSVGARAHSRKLESGLVCRGFPYAVIGAILPPTY